MQRKQMNPPCTEMCITFPVCRAFTINKPYPYSLSRIIELCKKCPKLDKYVKSKCDTQDINSYHDCLLIVSNHLFTYDIKENTK